MDWSARQQVMRLTTKVGMVAVAERGDGDGGRKTQSVCVQNEVLHPRDDFCPPNHFSRYLRVSILQLSILWLKED